MDDDYVQEACFYLSELGVHIDEIAKQMNIDVEQVKNAIRDYKITIDSGNRRYEEDTKRFWQKILQESSGDEKVTMVDEKGRYYHGWKSELAKMPTENLVELLVLNKRYSDSHPLSEFSKTQPVVGYDPLVPLRNIRRTVKIIDEILQRREKEDEINHRSE